MQIAEDVAAQLVFAFLLSRGRVRSFCFPPSLPRAEVFASWRENFSRFSLSSFEAFRLTRETRPGANRFLRRQSDRQASGSGEFAFIHRPSRQT